jgi:hypothetical protein
MDWLSALVVPELAKWLLRSHILCLTSIGQLRGRSLRKGLFMFTPEQSGRMPVKPPVGDIGVMVHLRPDQLADLDRWIRDIARRMGNEPSGRPEAIRDILQNHFDTQRQHWAREDVQKSKPAKSK